MPEIQEYPQMLYHPDGRKKVAQDENHYADLAKEGYCALDDDNKMPVQAKSPDPVNTPPRRGRPPKVKNVNDNALRS